MSNSSPNSPTLRRTGLSVAARRRHRRNGDGSSTGKLDEGRIMEMLDSSREQRDKGLQKAKGNTPGKDPRPSQAALDKQRAQHFPDVELGHMSSKDARKKVMKNEADHLLGYVDQIKSSKGGQVDWKQLGELNSKKGRRSKHHNQSQASQPVSTRTDEGRVPSSASREGSAHDADEGRERRSKQLRLLSEIEGDPAGVSMDELKDVIQEEEDEEATTHWKHDAIDAIQSISEATHTAKRAQKNQKSVGELKQGIMKSVPPLVLPRSGEAFDSSNQKLDVSQSAREAHRPRNEQTLKRLKSAHPTKNSENKTDDSRVEGFSNSSTGEASPRMSPLKLQFRDSQNFDTTTKSTTHITPSSRRNQGEATEGSPRRSDTDNGQTGKPPDNTHVSPRERRGALKRSTQNTSRSKPIWQSPRLPERRVHQFADSIVKRQHDYRGKQHSLRTDIGDLLQENGIDIATYRLRELLRQNSKDIPSVDTLSVKQAIDLALKHTQDSKEKEELTALAYIAGMTVESGPTRKQSVDLSHIKSSFALDQLVQRARMSDENEDGDSDSNGDAKKRSKSKRDFERLTRSFLPRKTARKVWKIHEHYEEEPTSRSASDTEDEGYSQENRSPRTSRKKLPYKTAEEYNISPRFSRKKLHEHEIGFEVQPLPFEPRGDAIQEYGKRMNRQDTSPRSMATSKSSSRKALGAFGVLQEELEASESRLRLAKSGKTLLFDKEGCLTTDSTRELSKAHSISYAYVPEEFSERASTDSSVEGGSFAKDEPQKGTMKEEEDSDVDTPARGSQPGVSSRRISAADLNLPYADMRWLQFQYEPIEFAERVFSDLESGGLGIVGGTRSDSNSKNIGIELLESQAKKYMEESEEDYSTAEKQMSLSHRVSSAQQESEYHRGLGVRPRRTSIVGAAYDDTASYVGADRHETAHDSESVSFLSEAHSNASGDGKGYYNEMTAKLPRQTPSPEPYLPLTTRKPTAPPAALPTHSPLRASRPAEMAHVSQDLAKHTGSPAESNASESSEREPTEHEERYKQEYETAYNDTGDSWEDFNLEDSQKRLDELMTQWIQMRTEPVDSIKVPKVPRDHNFARNNLSAKTAQGMNTYRKFLRSLQFDGDDVAESSHDETQDYQVTDAENPGSKADQQGDSAPQRVEKKNVSHLLEGQPQVQATDLKATGTRAHVEQRDLATSSVSSVPLRKALRHVDLGRLHPDLNGKKIENLSLGDQFEVTRAVSDHRLAKLLSSISSDRERALRYKFSSLSTLCDCRGLLRRNADDLQLMRDEAESARAREIKGLFEGSEWFNKLLEHLDKQQYAEDVTPAQRFIILAVRDTIEKGNGINEGFLEQILKALSQSELLHASVQLVLAFLRRIARLPLDTWSQMFTAHNLPSPVEALLQERHDQQRALGYTHSIGEPQGVEGESIEKNHSRSSCVAQNNDRRNHPRSSCVAQSNDRRNHEASSSTYQPVPLVDVSETTYFISPFDSSDRHKKIFRRNSMQQGIVQ
eukprot:gb/GECG01004737.1/.p1 GENE.gb/GECG01004737.1/~~gb/GECG01004737.1/.p1  ORF type:complete len:1497 (+),score=252.49 gb/GECG01004737.1/:1-4491(+)